MKRDMDLIRRILIEIEKLPLNDPIKPLWFEDVSNDEIAYHIMLLRQAGLIEAIDVSSSGGYKFLPK